MIVLDTNVVSELMRREPHPQVMKWFAGQAAASLFTTALTEAEVYYALALLPVGKRQTLLIKAAHAMFGTDFAGRILPFDSDAAGAYADIASRRRREGQPISQVDAQIAGITRSRGAHFATRNIRDFSGCDISLIDPWAI